MSANPKRSCLLIALSLPLGVATVVGFMLAVYQPDRPVAEIEPGSSPDAAFVVQIIRPRAGLPLGGLLPPQLFGFESSLGFASTSPGSTVDRVSKRRVELSADGWQLALVVDSAGRVSSETSVSFELLFEERVRKVRCRRGEPVVGTFDVALLSGSRELSGSFDVEVGRCKHAGTGEPLGWPSVPLVLHGSFDRLPLDGTHA